MAPKKGKKEAKADPRAKAKGKEPPPKPKKIPKPPACFTTEDLMRFKGIFKDFDEENIDKVPLKLIPDMLRTAGLNPKPAEVQQLFQTFLEDELVDTVELHEWYQMIEAKMSWGDDSELAVTRAAAALGHDEDFSEDPRRLKLCAAATLLEELVAWGEPLADVERAEWLRLAARDRTLDRETGVFAYEKFIENMNKRDTKMLKEPVNFFKLDQKTLAAMAAAKAEEERAEQARREEGRRARDEARRLKLVADGLLPPD